MFPGFEEVDQATMDAEKAVVDLLESDIQDLWTSQIADIQEALDAAPNKGKFLAPIARLPIGEELEPEGLSSWGKEYFKSKLRQIRVAKLKPLYP